MLFSPTLAGVTALDADTLAADKRDCRKIGPCGVGKKALYLSNRFFDRCRYVVYGDVARVFKRVAMSQGGFTGKGVFGAMAYLVVQLKDGSERQSYFKHEEQVDELLAAVAQAHPGIPTHSEAAERKLREAEEAEQARFLKELSPEGEAALRTLRDAKAYLEKRPGLSGELTAAAKQKRVVDRMKPGVKAGALLIAVLGVAAALYGVYGLINHTPGAGYFAAGGGVAFFATLSTGTLPSRWNSPKAAQHDWETAVENCRDFIGGKDFPVPPQYAHPAVLERMIRVVREGRATSVAEAYETMKTELRALDSSVTVSRKEYDEVVAIKPMFLVCDYRDEV